MKSVLSLLVALSFFPVTSFAVSDSQIESMSQKYENAKSRQNESIIRRDYDASTLEHWNKVISGQIGNSIVRFRVTARDGDAPARERAVLDNRAECLMIELPQSSGKVTCVLGRKVILDLTTNPVLPE